MTDQISNFRNMDNATWNRQIDACYRIVGEFLHQFALLEGELDDHITQALRLGATERVIVTANMPLAVKITTVQTLLNVRLAEGSDELKQALALTKRIHAGNQTRTMVAHCFFYPDPQGTGIRFQVLRAKGKVEKPSVEWSAAEARSQIERITDLFLAMSDLNKRLESRRLSKNKGDLVRALTRAQGPVMDDPIR